MGLTTQIGIMQGRLSSRIDGKIQAYPAKTWQKEFAIAKEIGYSAIEWIIEKPLEENALMSISGIKEINKVILDTGVKVDFVCADIFMQQPLVRMSEKIREENKEWLEHILIIALNFTSYFLLKKYQGMKTSSGIIVQVLNFILATEATLASI